MMAFLKEGPATATGSASCVLGAAFRNLMAVSGVCLPPIALGLLRVGLCLGLLCLAKAERGMSGRHLSLEYGPDLANHFANGTRIAERAASANATDEYDESSTEAFPSNETGVDNGPGGSNITVTVDTGDEGFSLFGLSTWTSYAVIAGIVGIVIFLIVLIICCFRCAKKQKADPRYSVATTMGLGKDVEAARKKIAAKKTTTATKGAGQPEEKYDHKAAIMAKFLKDSNLIAKTNKGKDLKGSEVINVINDEPGAYADQEDFESVSQRAFNATDNPEMAVMPGQKPPKKKKKKKAIKKVVKKIPVLKNVVKGPDTPPTPPSPKSPPEPVRKPSNTKPHTDKPLKKSKSKSKPRKKSKKKSDADKQSSVAASSAADDASEASSAAASEESTVVDAAKQVTSKPKPKPRRRSKPKKLKAKASKQSVSSKTSKGKGKSRERQGEGEGEGEAGGKKPVREDINKPTPGRGNPLDFLDVCCICCKKGTYHEPRSWDHQGRGDNWSPMAEVAKEQQSLADQEEFSKQWKRQDDDRSAADDSSAAGSSDSDSSSVADTEADEDEDSEEEGNEQNVKVVVNMQSSGDVTQGETTQDTEEASSKWEVDSAIDSDVESAVDPAADQENKSQDE